MGVKKYGVKKNEGEDRDRLEINKAALSAALFYVNPLRSVGRVPYSPRYSRIFLSSVSRISC